MKTEPSKTGFFVGLLIAFILFGAIPPSPAQSAVDTGDGGTVPKSLLKAGAPSGGGGEESGGGSGTALPDLFTGTMTFSYPIKVPTGRNGIFPNLNLRYNSRNGNDWVGVGWNLEAGAIERSAKDGVDYNGDDFVFKMDGATSDLVNIGNGEYRAKIEGPFHRYKKLGDLWEITDKKGTRYLYGKTANERVENPSAPSQIFRWNLSEVVDTHGNKSE